MGRPGPAAAVGYDGGPFDLNAGHPCECPGGGWWFEAGLVRTALPYSFMIGPNGEFGLDGDEPVPEVRGVTDTWCRRGDTLVAVHTGEARYLTEPNLRVTRIFEGIA